MQLYICLMPSIQSESARAAPANGAGAARLSVSDVGAHLRVIPGDFRVVITFHLADGTLGEAELKPLEAAGLLSELAKAIDRGNQAKPGIPLCEDRDA